MSLCCWPVGGKCLAVLTSGRKSIRLHLWTVKFPVSLVSGIKMASIISQLYVNNFPTSVGEENYNEREKCSTFLDSLRKLPSQTAVVTLPAPHFSVHWSMKCVALHIQKSYRWVTALCLVCLGPLFHVMYYRIWLLEATTTTSTQCHGVYNIAQSVWNVLVGHCQQAGTFNLELINAMRPGLHSNSQITLEDTTGHSVILYTMTILGYRPMVAHSARVQGLVPDN